MYCSGSVPLLILLFFRSKKVRFLLVAFAAICFNRETNPTPKGTIGLPRTWHGKDLGTVPSVQKQFMTEDQGKVIVDAEGPAWERYREIYREKVKLYDEEVGKVLTGIEDNDMLERTFVIATSDHGDMDGQHSLIYKGPFMYEHMMRVPLIIRPPATVGTKAPATLDFHTVNTRWKTRKGLVPSRTK